MLSDLKKYLEISTNDTSEDNLLNLLIKNATLAVARKRYPFKIITQNELDIVAVQYSEVIFRAVIIAYSKMGAEGESSRKELDAYITWNDDTSIFADVVPVIKVL